MSLGLGLAIFHVSWYNSVSSKKKSYGMGCFIVKRMFVCILCACLISCFSACGAKKSPEPEVCPSPRPGASAFPVQEENLIVVTPNPDELVAEESVVVPAGRFENVEAMMADPATSREFNTIVDKLRDQDGLTIIASGVGNTLRYEVRVSDEAYAVGEDVLSAAIRALMDTAEPELQAVADSLEEKTVAGDATLSVVYCRPNGTEFFSRSYVGVQADTE